MIHPFRLCIRILHDVSQSLARLTWSEGMVAAVVPKAGLGFGDPLRGRRTGSLGTRPHASDAEALPKVRPPLRLHDFRLTPC